MLGLTYYERGFCFDNYLIMDALMSLDFKSSDIDDGAGNDFRMVLLNEASYQAEKRVRILFD